MNQSTTLMIDDVKYVKADSVREPAERLEGLERVVIRSYGAGVFFGYLKEKKAEANGVNVILLKAKRIYYWDGACSLTQIAMEGTQSPDRCKITDAIDSQFIANVIEILPLTEKASGILDGVKLWKK